MKNKLFAYFDFNPEEAYPIVYSPVYCDNFNEEIDSMNLVIDGVSEVNRLNLEEPYHFVKIVNEVDLTLEQMIDSEILCSSQEIEYEELPEINETLNNLLKTSFNITPSTNDLFYCYFIYNSKSYIMKCRCIDSTYAYIEYSVIEYHIANTGGFLWKRDRYISPWGQIKWHYYNSIIMCLDNWVETKTNHNGIYRYEISLMNTIKILEKIQCPNRVITHDFDKPRKTISEYIDEYMKLYCPKIKKSTDGVNWSYEYLFDWSELLNFDEIAADMQMNEPTLRELLTNLLLQVDKIPTANYLKLGYIDFKEQQDNFVLQDDCFPKESGASDSYNNTITLSPSQILDSSNNVISEDIGFRDRNNALISQRANLELETRFPIYKVNRFWLTDAATTFISWPENQIYDSAEPSNTPYPRLLSSAATGYVNTYVILSGSSTTLRIGFRYLPNNFSDPLCFDTGILKNIKVHFCRYDSTSNTYYNYSTKSINQEWELTLNGTSPRRVNTMPFTAGNTQELLSNGTLGPTLSQQSNQYTYFLDTDITGLINPNYDVYMWFEYDFADNYNNKLYHCFVPVRLLKNNSYVLIRDPGNYNQSNYANYYTDSNNGPVPLVAFNVGNIRRYCDLTSLIVEERKRMLLNTDYAAMQNAQTLSEFSQYIYATMGYSIGGNKISGFSNVYSKAHLWWNEDKTYIDNITEFYENHGLIKIKKITESDNVLINSIKPSIGNMPIRNETIVPRYSNSMSFSGGKGTYLFEIDYQPLNNLKLKIPKENKNIPLDLTVLNQTESGLSDFDRFTANNQSMVNRTGNKIIQIPQTTNVLDRVQNLNSLYNKYTVFKRQIEINENYLTVLYTLSEKYVMQNYFTSIITKYRAYQNVDYNQSTVRKENLCVYCMLSENYYYNGTDHIKFRNNYTALTLLSGIDYNTNNKHKLKYLVRKSNNKNQEEEATKEELSVVSYNNGIGIVTQEFDNVSAGLYLSQASITGSSSAPLGGIPQKWQLWDLDEYNTSHQLNYVNNIAYLGTTGYSGFIALPILKPDYASYSDFVIFSIVDNQNSDVYIYYKDNAEVLNQTVQFHFYSDSENIIYNELLFENSSIVNKWEGWEIKVKFKETNELATGPYSSIGETLYNPGFYYDISSYLDANMAIIDVRWDRITGLGDNINSMVILITKDNICREIMAIDRDGKDEESYYYLTLNDTKTNDVWYFKSDNDLFETKECDNGIQRKIKNI